MIGVGSGHYLTPPSVTSERVHLFTRYDRKCEKQTEITRKEILESRIRKTNERVRNNKTRHEDKQRKYRKRVEQSATNGETFCLFSTIFPFSQPRPEFRSFVLKDTTRSMHMVTSVTPFLINGGKEDAASE